MSTISNVYVTIHGIRYLATATKPYLTEKEFDDFVGLCFGDKVEWIEARDPEWRKVIIGKESLKQGIYNHEVLHSK